MTIRKSILLVVPVLALILSAGADAAPAGDPYPLATCPVSGGKLGSMGAPFVYVHEGREVRFCCKGCLPKFKADPAKYLAKVDATIAKEQASRYPLKTCLVSGKAIDGDAKPIDHVWRNRLVRLHDRKCVEAFEKNPRKYVRVLDKAVVAAQKDAYPLDTCVISGGKLGSMGAVVDHVHAGRLVRFCCRGCIGAFDKNPAAALAKIDAAKASSAPEAPKAASDCCGTCGGESGGGAKSDCCGTCGGKSGCGAESGCGRKSGAGSGGCGR
jgi:YHS domain-containing protein